jgi:sensor histidine kinase regulating citrate/malate metabolism
MEKKNQMTFNHQAESLVDSLGVEQHKYASQLATILTLLSSGEMDKVSKVSEMMHKCVDYNILLLLATNHLLHIAEGFNQFTDLSDN